RGRDVESLALQQQLQRREDIGLVVGNEYARLHRACFFGWMRVKASQSIFLAPGGDLHETWTRIHRRLCLPARSRRDPGFGTADASRWRSVGIVCKDDAGLFA